MTFLENKKIFLSLVDEYAPDNQYFTEDDDIPSKVAWLYAPAYQELADEKTSLKMKTIEVTATTGNIGYEEFSLPKCKQVKKVVALDENNNKISADYYFLGEKIFISNSKTAKYIIEYIPFLTLIDAETEDDFELEIDQDLQAILPYIVAADLLKTDPSANYKAFEQVLNRKLQRFNSNKKGISVNITEGEL